MLQQFDFMFKQQQKVEHNITRQQNERREEGTQGNRIAGFGIKVISNWMDDRKGNNASQGKREHGKSPILKADSHPQQQPSKIASTRGIKVISSRQSSNERPYVTSRSNSKQKESKQIKSQTNISEFDSGINSKEPSFEKQQTSRQFDQESVINAIELRFKEAMAKQRAVHELQVDQLKEIIESNEQRIDNLITTLNYLVEGGGRKQKGVGRLQYRVNSNQKYAEQCYEYTLARCSDSEVILRHLSQSIHSSSVKNIQIENKMEYIERIIVDIFTVQRTLVYQQQANFHSQIRRLSDSLNGLQQKLGELEQLELRHSLQDMRSINWREHILELRQKLEAYNPGMQVNQQKPVANYEWINREELAIKMEGLQFKLAQLQSAKIILEAEARAKEEKSGQAIWELSSLLNKHERELERVGRQNTSLVSYNKEIQNKLIESRCRENSMQIYMQNQLKVLENSAISEENSRIAAENEVFREKYEELFRHNQYLEDINCRNKLELINAAKLIEELQNKLQQAEKQEKGEGVQLQYKLVALGEEIETLKRKLAQSLRRIEEKDSEIFAKSMEVQKATADAAALRNQIHAGAYKIENLQIQLQQVLAQKEALDLELSQLRSQLITTRKELQEEETYTQHLEKENEKMEGKLQEYTHNFEEQSQMFRTTIDRLKRQREEIKYSEPKTDRPSSSKPTASNPKALLPASNPSMAKAQQQKLLRLKKAVDAAGYKKPVPCEIDVSGYQKHLAIRTNLIQLFQ